MFGGLLINKLGIRCFILTCSVTIAIGAVIIYSAVLNLKYLELLLGQFFLGIGGENLINGLNCYSGVWFQDSYISLAYAVS